MTQLVYHAGIKENIEQHQPGDAGDDLLANETVIIPPMENSYIKTGVHLELPADTVGIIKERSSLAAKGIIIGGGVIDSTYRGEVIVIVRNFNHLPYVINKGDKIAQLVILPRVDTQLVKTRHLTETERGSKGFGSTDRKW